jgi:hypothetical protein
VKVLAQVSSGELRGDEYKVRLAVREPLLELRHRLGTDRTAAGDRLDGSRDFRAGVVDDKRGQLFVMSERDAFGGYEPCDL